MMDEVQTGGGATGEMWCHKHFGIKPDIVSFSKKMVSGGIYHNLEHRPPHPGRIINTWVGDPHKIILLEQVFNIILISENIHKFRGSTNYIILHQDIEDDDKSSAMNVFRALSCKHNDNIIFQLWLFFCGFKDYKIYNIINLEKKCDIILSIVEH